MWKRCTTSLSMALTFVVAVGLVPATATASDSSDVLVLMTEIVDGDIAGGDRQVRFWWSSTDDPQWTGSDEVVLGALENAGLQPAMPDSVDISRIYRRPGLSTNNAAQVGRLLGAERVLVGEIEYRPVEPVAPLGYRGIEAHANLTLVPAGDSDGVALDQFTITRQVFDGDTEELLGGAREVTGTALGDVMGHSLHRASGRVGGQADAGVFALRDIGRAEYLEAIRNRLTDIDEVGRVVERWASEGVVALQVHTDSESSDDRLEYALRVLEHHDFEEFELIRSDESTVDDLTEFWIEPKAGE